MSQKSSLRRTIEILKHLNEGKQLCVMCYSLLFVKKVVQYFSHVCCSLGKLL